MIKPISSSCYLMLAHISFSTAIFWPGLLNIAIASDIATQKDHVILKCSIRADLIFLLILDCGKPTECSITANVTQEGSCCSPVIPAGQLGNWGVCLIKLHTRLVNMAWKDPVTWHHLLRKRAHACLHSLEFSLQRWAWLVDTIVHSVFGDKREKVLKVLLY